MSLTEQLSPLAKAISTRDFEEGQRYQIRFTELTGVPFQPVNPFLKEVLILSSATILDRALQNPTSLDAQSYLMSAYENLDDSIFEQILQEMQKDHEPPLPITANHLRLFAQSSGQDSLSVFAKPSLIEDRYNKSIERVNEAKVLAQEKNIDNTDVFLNDALYEELIRRTQTPKEVADNIIALTKGVTTESMTDFLLKQMATVLTMAREALGAESPLETEEMVQMAATDHEFKRTVRTFTLVFKHAAYQISGEQIERFWGSEGLDTLPKTTRAKLQRKYRYPRSILI